MVYLATSAVHLILALLVVVVGASFPILPLAYYNPRTDCLSCSQRGNRFCCRSCFSIKLLQEGRRSCGTERYFDYQLKKGALASGVR